MVAGTIATHETRVGSVARIIEQSGNALFELRARWHGLIHRGRRDLRTWSLWF